MQRYQRFCWVTFLSRGAPISRYASLGASSSASLGTSERSMTQVRFYDKRNVSWDACLNYGTLLNDGFRNDLFFRTFNPQYFGPEAAGKQPQLAQHLATFSRWGARYAKLKILKGELELFLLYNGETPVATCTCVLPLYKQKPLTWFEWIRVKLYEYYCVIADYWDGNPAKKLFTPDRVAFFNQMYYGTGSKDNSPETLARLAQMSPQELQKALYPSEETLYVQILAVAYDLQSKGYGSQILQAALDHYKGIEGPIFSDGTRHTQAPAMSSLFPSNGNETFYNRFGFKTVGTTSAYFPNGDKFEHKYMQRLLNC